MIIIRSNNLRGVDMGCMFYKYSAILQKLRYYHLREGNKNISEKMPFTDTYIVNFPQKFDFLSNHTSRSKHLDINLPRVSYQFACHVKC